MKPGSSRLHAFPFGRSSPRNNLLLEPLKSRHHVFVNAICLFMEVGDLQFGFDIYVVLNVGANLVLLSLTVLTDQNKARQEDGFQRNNHRQQSKGKRIKSY